MLVARLGHVHATRSTTAAAAIGRLMTNTQPPRHRVDEAAAEERARRRWRCRPSPDHAPMARPRSSGRNDADMIARLLGTSSAAATPCSAAGRDQRAGVGRDRAQQRRRRERDQPDDEDPAAPVAVAERAAEHEQRAERQQVAGEHPLQVAEVRVQVVGDRGQRGVDDGAVEERDARAEHRGGDDPPTLRGAHAEVEGSHTSSEPRAWQNQSMATDALARRCGSATSSATARASPTSSTSICTSCTRSRRRRRSTACASPAAPCAGPTSPSRRWTTTCRPTDIDQPVADPISAKQMEVLARELRGVRHPALRRWATRARASCT